MTYTIYIVQAVAIMFAVMLAKHDAAAISLFNSPDPNLGMARFHRYNNWVKAAFCLVAATTGIPDVLNMGFAGVLSFLWIWLVFDPALNKSTPGRGWDFLSQNDADGRRWIKWFGENAGETKAVILLSLIVIVNAIKIFI